MPMDQWLGLARLSWLLARGVDGWLHEHLGYSGPDLLNHFNHEVRYSGRSRTGLNALEVSGGTGSVGRNCEGEKGDT